MAKSYSLLSPFIERWEFNMANSSQEHIETYLMPTHFIDSDSHAIVTFAQQCACSAKTEADRAISIFYAVRDQIRYDPYHIDLSPDTIKASMVLTRQRGWCVEKALLLAAAARALEIPSRLGFADIRNHLVPESLKKVIGTDLFVFHGYTEMFLNSRWIKATPAFDLSLCTRWNFVPVEFTAEQNAVFHAFDKKGNKHIEYITDHGTFADLPLGKITAALRALYPRLFDENETAEKLKNQTRKTHTSQNRAR